MAPDVRRRAAFAAIWRTIRASWRPGAPGLGERLAAVPRMLRARRRGEYEGLDLGRLLLMIGSVAYVISPIDLMPELFLFVFGVADDLVVATWAVGALLDETERFLAWERERARVIPGEAVIG